MDKRKMEKELKFAAACGIVVGVSAIVAGTAVGVMSIICAAKTFGVKRNL